MSIELIPITRDVLAQMQDVLNASAGYAICLDDELEYFDPEATQGWLLAQDTLGRHLGFVRYFKQSDQWSLAEWHLVSAIENRREVAHKLLKAFKAQTQFPAGHRLRFDVQITDKDIHSVLDELGFSVQKQVFHYYELSLPNSEMKALNVATPGTESAKELAKVLSHLHPVREGEALKWLSDGTIRTHIVEKRIASAAHLSIHDSSAEIVRIATHADFARSGAATKLVEQICAELNARKISHIYLKVEIIRQPAIMFYKKFGFQENEFKSQIWHSRWY